jgi:hypothetical protein
LWLFLLGLLMVEKGLMVVVLEMKSRLDDLPVCKYLCWSDSGRRCDWSKAIRIRGGAVFNQRLWLLDLCRSLRLKGPIGGGGRGFCGGAKNSIGMGQSVLFSSK